MHMYIRYQLSTLIILWQILSNLCNKLYLMAILISLYWSTDLSLYIVCATLYYVTLWRHWEGVYRCSPASTVCRDYCMCIDMYINEGRWNMVYIPFMCTAMRGDGTWFMFHVCVLKWGEMEHGLCFMYVYSNEGRCNMAYVPCIYTDMRGDGTWFILCVCVHQWGECHRWNLWLSTFDWDE